MALPVTCVEWSHALIRAAAVGRDTEALLAQRPAEPDSDRDLLARAAVAVGTAQRALVLARKRAGTRFVAGRPLIEMQSTGHRLARVGAKLAVARISVLAASRDEDSGAGAGYRAPAVAAAAAEVAFAASHALVQVYGAAGTSDDAPVAAFQACQAVAGWVGPPAELWLRAARRRGVNGAGRS
jgi:alkylation response protein AidB-like acyl-CoA dehydrogenase